MGTLAISLEMSIRSTCRGGPAKSSQKHVPIESHKSVCCTLTPVGMARLHCSCFYVYGLSRGD
jgi:hypothetical protein